MDGFAWITHLEIPSEFFHLQIPTQVIKSATRDMDEEEYTGSYRAYITYKAQIFWSGQLIDTVVHSSNQLNSEGVSWFENCVNFMISGLKHKNIFSFLGCSADRHQSLMVSKYEINGDLSTHLGNYKSKLSWTERLRICVGVAHGLSYLHYEEGRDNSLIHCNIKSSSILLDDKWEPKIGNFGQSIITPVAHRHRLHHAKQHSGTEGYMDTIYEKTKGVTQKSDVFSFGVVLFEVLIWCRAWTVDSNHQEPLVQWARSGYEQGTLKAFIANDVWEEMDEKSFKIFSETAYSCLKEERAQRPSMDHIVRRLEKALELQINFQNHGQDLEGLKIELSDIMFATENFAENYCIGSGGYGKVYKAVLHLQGKISSQVEENKKGELTTKIGKTVAIKRIFSRGDKQGEDGFFAEIEALTSCRNRNIISLVGFCVEGPERILVYEHASNGSLDDYLESIGNRAKLSWAQRIRICLGISRGLHYLHSSTNNKKKIIHRDIKSANILLYENWEAKIADLGLSRLQALNEKSSTINTFHIAGTEVYLDPEYVQTGKLKKATDVYSLGVVMLEILCGRVAYDQIYMAEDDKGLGPIARRRYDKGTLKQMIDPILMQESDEILFTQTEGLNEESLATFSNIAYRCLAESQAKRPTMEVVIQELEQALSFQENSKDSLKFSLEEIKLATQNFSENNVIREAEIHWRLYRGEVPPRANGSNIFIAKRLMGSIGFLEKDFFTEFTNLYEYKHENIIGVVGYCNEKGERIIVYENASKGRLSSYLEDPDLTWTKRLGICIDVASGLDFLHGGNATRDVVVHRSIRSSSILLDGDWKARISDLGTSLVSSRDNEIKPDPLNYANLSFDAGYDQGGTLTTESDIFSFGVVLFEILCGSRTSSFMKANRYLGEFVRSHFPEGKLDERVFEGIKEQIVPQSLAAFQEIVLQCLHDKRQDRPTAARVLMQLKKALDFQEDYEVWESKLPKDYPNIISMSKTPEIYSMAKKEDLHDMLLKGIIIQEGNVSFSIGSNGKRNELISARTFSYKNRWSHKWRSVPKSRFHKVAEMLDILDLNIQIKIRAQLLSSGVDYGVHLTFRFCGPRKSVGKRMYVNLKYKKRSETLHAYFATWREDEWMTIELCRFMNHDENINDFEFLLESFSRCYCESRGIYIEGIEFRAIDNAIHEEIKELKENQQLQKSELNTDKVQQWQTNCDQIENYDEGEKFFSQNEVNKKKHYMLSAKEALYKSGDVKLLDSITSTQPRFQEVIELRSQAEFRIMCEVERDMLSPETNYACYLVFKLSEKCSGLHCPVIVRDLLKRKKKEKGIIYFKTPSPCNVYDTDRVPEDREDGWKEVNVWQFKSGKELRDDCVSINLKLISYEGTMSGLIVSSLEFRPLEGGQCVAGNSNQVKAF